MINKILSAKNKFSPISLLLIIIIAVVINSSNTAFAQNRVIFTTTLNALGNRYSDGSMVNSYYLYSGIRFQAQDYYLSLNIPLVYNSSGSFAKIGNMYIPNDNGGGGSIPSSGIHGKMMRDNNMSSMKFGIGDMYLYSSYNLLSTQNSYLGLSLDGFIKFPTASQSLNTGTGKIDFSIASSAKKIIGTFSFFVQAGYLFLGNAGDSNVNNPFTFSTGIGNNFGNGNHLLLLEYDSHSTVIVGYSSPKQLSLGYTYLINSKLSYMMTGSAGLNNASPDYSVSLGFNFDIY